jgi:nitrous oxide reductase accessory protein NosL
MTRRGILAITLLIFQMGCQERSKSDIAKIHWDRDMCAKCVMVISDRQNSVQVRDPKGKTYMFDDIGCMVLWFKENNTTWQNQAKVWITDLKTSKWIDARKAFYTKGHVTPMAYGFSAYKTKASIIDKDKKIYLFNQVAEEVLKKEKKLLNTSIQKSN